MRRNGLQLVLAALFLLAIPALANAWTLTVKVTGGSLPSNTVVLSGGASKTITSGSYTVYPSTATTVTVNTAAGSTSSVTLDGFAASSSFALNSGSHTVVVSYSAPASSSVTVNQGTGGAVYVQLPNNTWTSTGSTGLPVGTTLPYSVSADGDHTITSYTVNGVTTAVNGTAKGQVITGSFKTVAGNNSVGASFGFAPTITGSLSAPTNGFTMQPVSCTATATSNDTGLQYAFVVTGPASFSRGASSSQSFSFTPLLTGTYSVTATVTSLNGGSFTTAASQVVVTTDQANLNAPCISCHSTQSPAIVNAYLAGTLHTQSRDSACVACHTQDTPHSAGINATTVDATVFAVKTDGTAGLAKGASFCVKCHDATIDAAFGASPHQAAALTCATCHTSGVHNVDFTTQPVRPFADESYLNRNLGRSNICMTCHSGALDGQSIQAKVGSADFGKLPFIAPSLGTAGGTLHGTVGYHFPGQTYAFYSSNSHRVAGMGNRVNTGTGGPCVACHMTSAAKHSYQAATADTGGNITAIVSGACANCHAASLGAAELNAGQADFQNALVVLKAMLADKGFVYTDSAPYFSNTNWGSGQTGANVMGAAYNYVLLFKEAGAYAHNGAYAKKLIFDSIDLLYNGSVTGSIDAAVGYLQGKGAISQDVATGITGYKTANSCSTCHTNNTGSHSAHIAGGVGCADCHSQTAAGNATLIPGTQRHLNGVRDVNFATGGSYAAGNCSSVYCHSNGAGSYLNPTWGGGSANCNFCHPIATLRGAHAAHLGSTVPSVYGDTANHSTAAGYSFGCGNCHPTDLASHLDRHIEVTLVPTPDGSLRSKNDPSVVVSGIGNTGSGISGISGSSVVCSAAYCHSNGAAAGSLSYVASPDWYNAAAYSGDRCAMCHGNAPATGAHGKHAVGIHVGQVSDGSGNLILGHGDAAHATVVNCDLCHSLTVGNSFNDKGSACAPCHTGDPKGTPTLDKTAHLNGSVEVAFKDVKVVTRAQISPAGFSKYSGVWARTSYKVDASSYDTAKLSLNQAAFAGDKSCSNVACHNGGTPKWSDRLSCVSCHAAL